MFGAYVEHQGHPHPQMHPPPQQQQQQQPQQLPQVPQDVLLKLLELQQQQQQVKLKPIFVKCFFWHVFNFKISCCVD